MRENDHVCVHICWRYKYTKYINMASMREKICYSYLHYFVVKDATKSIR